MATAGRFERRQVVWFPTGGRHQRPVVLLLLQQCDGRGAALAGPSREACFPSLTSFSFFAELALFYLLPTNVKKTN